MKSKVQLHVGKKPTTFHLFWISCSIISSDSLSTLLLHTTEWKLPLCSFQTIHNFTYFCDIPIPHKEKLHIWWFLCPLLQNLWWNLSCLYYILSFPPVKSCLMDAFACLWLPAGCCVIAETLWFSFSCLYLGIIYSHALLYNKIEQTSSSAVYTHEY